MGDVAAYAADPTVSQPKVSIIVPCYNGGRFLDQMLASLAAQTFRDFEIIIVDDGSTEPETIAKLASLPADIRVVRQTNGGLAAARNTGFREAGADIVLPLDCDDSLAPGFLSETVALLSAAPPDLGFVFTDMRATGAFGGVLPRRFNRFDQLFLNRLPYCLLLRKSAWAKVGGYDAMMRDGYEDWEFNIRLTLAGFRAIGIKKPLFIYYVSPGGMLMSRSARLHGALWQYILSRQPDVYNWRGLRELHRRWRDPENRIGLFTALLLVWSGRLLPKRIVSAVFYNALRLSHRLRVWRGILAAPAVEAFLARKGTIE
jgi:glycosyltransferase involved in cell wall biosynthesis